MYYKIEGKLVKIEPKDVERIIAVGDIHGDFYAFKKIEDLFDPNKDLLVFLGDYADRGPNSVEVIEGVQKLIQKYSKRIIALKGNHEDYSDDGTPRFSPCTLIEEVERKRGSWSTYFKKLKKEFLDKLYLAALIPESILFIHGGISDKIKSEDDLINPSRAVEEDILWSDPYEEKGEFYNPRGAGVLFGPDISKKITERLNIKYIIRSHEPRKALFKPAVEHEGRVATISSTSVYGGKPFVLILPVKNLPKNSKEIENYVVFL